MLQWADDAFADNKLNVEYILTSKKNSDCIENFFSSVRGYNGFNRNPSVQDFNNMMGRMMSMKLLGYASTLSNCEPDDDEYLRHALKSVDVAESSSLSREDLTFKGAITDRNEDGHSLGPPLEDNFNLQDISLRNYLEENDVEFDDVAESSSLSHEDLNYKGALAVQNKDEHSVVAPAVEDVFNLQDISLRYYLGYVLFQVSKKKSCYSCESILISDFIRNSDQIKKL